MKQKLSLLLCVVAAYCAVSCQGDIDVIKHISLSCRTMGMIEGAATTEASWGSGEQIYLFRAEDWTVASMTQTSGEGSDVAVFSGNASGTRLGYYAVRPSSAAGAIRVSGDIAIDVAPTNIFFVGENSSVAVPQIGEGNSSGLTFSSIFGALKFNVEGINSVSSVEVSVPGQERGVYGTFQYNFTQGTIYGEDVSYEVVRNCSPAMDISSSKAIYVALPPGGYKTVEMLIVDAETGEKSLYRASNIAVRRGNVMQVPASSYVYVPQVVGRWHIKSYCGAEAPVDLYIEFKADFKFTIMQRTESFDYLKFDGVYTEDKESSTISGVYSDGESWSDSYRYIINENRELVLTSVSNGAEVSVYEPADMPNVSSVSVISRASSVKPL